MDAKILLRKELLEGMCSIAESIYFSYYRRELTFLYSECPKQFKPGVADKFIFNRIIDGVIDNIIAESDIIEGKYFPKKASVRMTAVQVMAKYYWPQYGEWKVMPKLSVRERRAL